MPLKLLALILPLSLDTFAVSAAMGVAGVDGRRRLRLSLLLSGFEAIMPLLGFLAGAAAGGALGGAAEWAAVVVLVAVGVFMVVGSDDTAAGDRLARVEGWSMIGLGLSVSIDELAIGLAAGLAGLPILVVVILIAAQAFVAAQLGTRFGARLGARLREGAETLAGLMLIALAGALVTLRLTGHGG